MTLLIRDALLQARHCGVDRLDAQLLLAHVCSGGLQSAAGTAATPDPPLVSRSWLLAHDDHALTAAQAATWDKALQRRAAGEPLAYVVGEQSFCGLRLQVSPAVLIPRPETEGLVDWALECLQAGSKPVPRVLDLGTGSGAIALAIKHRCPSAQVWATDISPAALAIAQANARRLRLDVGFGLRNWWAPVAPPVLSTEGKLAFESAWNDSFDLVVSNPPYIEDSDPHLNALQHEPSRALVGAEQHGLGDLRAIIQGAWRWMAPDAGLLLEHGHDQGQAVLKLLQQAGFVNAQTRLDLAGLPRCTGGRRTKGLAV